MPRRIITAACKAMARASPRVRRISKKKGIPHLEVLRIAKRRKDYATKIQPLLKRITMLDAELSTWNIGAHTLKKRHPDHRLARREIRRLIQEKLDAVLKPDRLLKQNTK